jgi:hypothetical protein
MAKIISGKRNLKLFHQRRREGVAAAGGMTGGTVD